MLLAELPAVPSLRPIAVEGGTVLGCVAFLPLSLAGLALAMLAHAALSGLQCGLWMSQCRSANGLPVHPIGYGLTAARYAAPKEGKAAWVGVTPMRHPSDGYDLLEHYEIIAAGGLPYVLHLCAPLPRPLPRRAQTHEPKSTTPKRSAAFTNPVTLSPCAQRCMSTIHATHDAEAAPRAHTSTTLFTRAERCRCCRRCRIARLVAACRMVARRL